jgi:hypothetical protein
MMNRKSEGVSNGQVNSEICLKPVYFSDVSITGVIYGRDIKENFAASGGERFTACWPQQLKVTGMYGICQQVFTKFNAL